MLRPVALRKPLSIGTQGLDSQQRCCLDRLTELRVVEAEPVVELLVEQDRLPEGLLAVLECRSARQPHVLPPLSL